jgi:hypothetical protein
MSECQWCETILHENPKGRWGRYGPILGTKLHPQGPLLESFRLYAEGASEEGCFAWRRGFLPKFVFGHRFGRYEPRFVGSK